MSLVQAVLMGIIQGLTEFLPVSSSGHLALFRILFGVETETGMLFDVLLHAGTLAAIFAVYYKDILKLFAEGFCIIQDVCINATLFFKKLIKKQDVSYRKIINNHYRKFVMLIIVSTIPTAIIGFVGRDVVEAASGLLIVPGVCLVITAILLFIADYVKGGKKLPKDITYTNAFMIGIAQGIATLPGLSRSGTTITACLLSGFHRKFAVKYSFLMSIPAILGAIILEVKDVANITIDSTQLMYELIGMAIAAVIGYVCIKTMLVIVQNKKFRIFAVYCLIVGAISIGGFFYTL